METSTMIGLEAHALRSPVGGERSNLSPAEAPLARPWQVIDRFDCEEGLLELRQRGPDDFHLCLDGRILMNSRAGRSEEALGRWAAEAVAKRESPRLLLAGLGMGLTLRASLGALPQTAEVVVAELHPRVLEWCGGPLRELSGNAVADPRVEVVIGDVAAVIRAADREFDGIALDLYEGVRPSASDLDPDPFYGTAALERVARALRAGGVFARWCEQRDAAFEQRLTRAGFRVEQRSAGRGGRRHTVYCARQGA